MVTPATKRNLECGQDALPTTTSALYTLWHEGTWRDIAFAAIHCTGGDVAIATATLFGASSDL